MQQSERDLTKESGLPARGKGQEGKGCHLPPETQRAAMDDAVRCDGQRTALRQLGKKAATPRRAPAAYRLNALKDANVSSRSRFASNWRVRTDR